MEAGIWQGRQVDSNWQSAREQGPQFSPAGNYSASKKELGSGFLFMASRLAVNPGDTLISAFWYPDQKTQSHQAGSDLPNPKLIVRDCSEP